MAGIQLPRRKVNFSIINRTPKLVFDEAKFKCLPFYINIHQVQRPMIVFCVSPIMPHLALPNRDYSEFEIKFDLPSSVISIIQQNPPESIQLQIRFGRDIEGMSELLEQLPELIQIDINNHSRTTENSPINFNCNEFLNLRGENKITISWPFHDNPYYMAVDIVKVLSIEHMIEQVKIRNKLHSLTLNTRAKAVEIIRAASNGTNREISESNAYIFNLLCPITRLKMKLPSRSLKCNHLQCFDLYALFTLNKIKPTWKCPICHLAIDVNDLVIDTFLWDIVATANLPDSYYRIIVYYNGNFEGLEDETWPDSSEDDESESDNEDSEDTTFTDNSDNSNDEKTVIPKIENINPDD